MTLNSTSIATSLLALLAVFAVHGCGRPQPETPITYYYIDKTGTKVLDGVGYYGDTFHDGLALVCDDFRDDGDVQQLRYIDHAGKTVFSKTAYEAQPFSEGLAAIDVQLEGVRGGCVGYADTAGRWVIPPRYHGIGEPFSDGLALVSTPQWHMQFIDHSGKKQVDISEKLSSIVPRLWFQNVSPFSEGLALIEIGDREHMATPWRYGFIDKAGRWQLEPTEMRASTFCEGLSSCARPGKPLGNVRAPFINHSGKQVLELPYEARNFSEGLCCIRDVEHNKYGYCDKRGTVVIKPQYDSARNFSEDLAPVTVAGKIGYIDKTGKIVITPQFAYAGDFSEGVAVVVPFGKDGSKPQPKVWQEPSGKHFSREGAVQWSRTERTSFH